MLHWKNKFQFDKSLLNMADLDQIISIFLYDTRTQTLSSPPVQQTTYYLYLREMPKYCNTPQLTYCSSPVLYKPLRYCSVETGELFDRIVRFCDKEVAELGNNYTMAYVMINKNSELTSEPFPPEVNKTSTVYISIRLTDFISSAVFNSEKLAESMMMSWSGHQHEYIYNDDQNYYVHLFYEDWK
jgi:hypothetical protein